MKASRLRDFLLKSGACGALWVVLGVGCRHQPTQKEEQGALIHHDLGVQAMQAGEIQGALREFQTSLELDPNLAESHNAIGLLLHVSFQHKDEAIAHFKRALEIRPSFSEARANLANVYLDQGRYDEAVAMYRETLNDMLYPTPFIAQGNLGWALYKKGDRAGGLDQIKAAVIANPKFCQGYRNLGIIYEETGGTDEACLQFGKYREACPEVADAYYREGRCLTRKGQREAAIEAFSKCQAKATNEAIKDDCRQLQAKLR